LDKCVLGPDFSTDFGKILSAKSNSSAAFKVDGDYSAGEVAIGRAYTMSILLSRPYVHDEEKNADVNAEVVIREITASLHKTGQFKIRSDMPSHPDRTVAMDVDPIQERAVLRSMHTGNAEDNDIYLENDSAKPAVVTAIEYIVDYYPRQG